MRNLYDPVTRTWTRGANMSVRRWYPTATTLPDGRILAISGWSTPGRLADVPEVYDPRTNTWSALTAAARSNAMYSFMFVLPDGSVFEAGPGVVNGAGSTMTWRLDVNAQRWTAVGDSLFTGGSAVMYAPGRVMKSGTLGDPDYPLPSVDARTAVIAAASTAASSSSRRRLRHPDEPAGPGGGDHCGVPEERGHRQR